MGLHPVDPEIAGTRQRASLVKLDRDRPTDGLIDDGSELIDAVRDENPGDAIAWNARHGGGKCRRAIVRAARIGTEIE